MKTCRFKIEKEDVEENFLRRIERFNPSEHDITHSNILSVRPDEGEINDKRSPFRKSEIYKVNVLKSGIRKNKDDRLWLQMGLQLLPSNPTNKETKAT